MKLKGLLGKKQSILYEHVLYTRPVLIQTEYISDSRRKATLKFSRAAVILAIILYVGVLASKTAHLFRCFLYAMGCQTQNSLYISARPGVEQSLLDLKISRSMQTSQDKGSVMDSRHLLLHFFIWFDSGYVYSKSVWGKTQKSFPFAFFWSWKVYVISLAIDEDLLLVLGTFL